MAHRITITGSIFLGIQLLLAVPGSAQIAAVHDESGRRVFINDNAPALVKGAPTKPRSAIYLPAAPSFIGHSRPAVHLDRDGAERIVREAADRHNVDPALVRAVIQTESGWDPSAVSRRGAVGLMQLHPMTAQRFGVDDVFNPQENVDAGVRYLKGLLQRYKGNLDLALAAYNAGEGAVDRHGGIPPFRETGRLASGWTFSRAIHKETDTQGRIIFRND
jgi:soluble lytic murein transglycosylase-like protein